MLLLPFWIYPSFLLTAVIYATVGFGGGSTYLALLSLTALPLAEVAAIALFCNLIVSGGGVWHFSKAGWMRPRLIWPFLITSIPAAYLGGSFRTEDSVYRIVLAGCLFLVALRFWLGDRAGVQNERPMRLAKGPAFTVSALLIGAALGWVSGFIGIGGGIFLSPLLILARWANIKESSAAAAIFILLNSAAGLAARGHLLQSYWPECLVLGAIVFIGGQPGSLAGARKLPLRLMQQCLAGFISWTVLRLVWVAL